MSCQSLNLPINVPWKQIAVSPDMMDRTFCNKRFPFAWRTSMAISVYEPKPEDLPEELCGDLITYIKVTTSITGYQPTKKETSQLDDYLGNKSIVFSDVSLEDYEDAFKRLSSYYFACYGVMLNVAVFSNPNTKKELIERNRIDFSKIRKQGLPNNSPFLEPGTTLDNPYNNAGVIFESGQQQNSLVNLITLGNGTDSELDIHTKIEITIPATTGLAAVEARITYLSSAGVKMEAFSANGLVGTEISESAPNQVHTLTIKSADIIKVIITSSENNASLLEFAYFISKEVALTLEDYPHIISFEPNRRDLYQAATQTGEVLTGSSSGIATNKASTEIMNTEQNVKSSISVGVPPYFGGGVDNTVSTSLTNQNETSLQQDASQEKRETQGMNTQLSQMYNLLTGYHAGTNRASFLSLARPHTLPPTDNRTFVQGLRAIEGMQEYFLVVSRPKGTEGLCIEASLETGNYPENAQIPEPPEEFDEYFEDYTFSYRAEGGRTRVWKSDIPAECKDINESREIPADFVVDKRSERKRKLGQGPESGWDQGHPGVAFLGDIDQESIKNLNYEIVGRELVVTGTLCGRNATGGFAGTDIGDLNGGPSIFNGTFRVFLKPTEPKANYNVTDEDIGLLLITSRDLCVCFKSGECIEVIPSPPKDPIVINRIVDEPMIQINKSIMTKKAKIQNRMPLEKQFLQQVQNALTKSHRSTSRYAFDDNVGFLESNYFKDHIKKLLPEEYLKRPLGKVKELPGEIVKKLGSNLTIAQALAIDLAQFARRTELSIREASKVRHQLLGIAQTSKGKKTNETPE